MLKVIIILLVLIALGVIGLVAVSAMKPGSFKVQRSIAIKAPPERIFALINDFHQWGQWSPWEKLDPQMTRQYHGAESGEGAGYSWEGKKAGAGGMTILEADPAAGVTIALDFTKPFKASNVTRFDLQPNGSETIVTWTMTGKSPLISKVMDTIFSMDKMVGGDFEKGLADLKAAAERPVPSPIVS